MMTMRISSSFVLFVLVISGIYAQDTHYWTNQFGSKSALLGGAVIGGTHENDMVFYNPGALGFMDGNSVSVNANAYRIESIKILDVLDREQVFKNSNFASIPVLIGGMINLKHPKWRLGYGILSPVKFNFAGTSRTDTEINAVNDQVSPGNELIIAEIQENSSLSEFTATWGIARKLSDHFSLGLSHLFTFRSMNYSDHYIIHVQVNDINETQISSVIVSQAKYYHQRLRFKLGANYQKYPWKIGLTVSSPSIGLFGKGTVAGDVTAHNVPMDNEFKSFFASDRQEDLKSKFKMPLSIGFGINYSFPVSRLYISGEYFFKVDEYNILRPQETDFFRSSNIQAVFGSSEFLQVTGGMRSVFNVALGYEWDVKQDMTLFFSMRTDNSFRLNNSNSSHRISTEISSWNIYHLTAGTSKTVNNNIFTVGLLFGYGHNGDHQETNIFNGPGDNGTILGSSLVADARYLSFGLLVGYKFNLKNK